MAKIYSTYCSNGGMGKTFVAINLAWCLRTEAHAKVLLIDAKQLVSNGVESLLSEQFGATLADYYFAENDNEKKYRNAPVASWSGLDIMRLSSVGAIWQDSDESRTWLQNLLLFLDDKYQYIVIDTGGHLDATLLAMLDFSDFILLLTSGEPADLRIASEDLALFRKLNFRKDLIKIIVNRWGSKESLDPMLVTSKLTMDLFSVIPLAEEGTFVFGAESGKKKKDQRELRSAFINLTLNLVHDKNPAIRRRDQSENRHKNAGIGLSASDTSNTIDPEVLRSLKITIHEKLLEILDLKRIDAEIEENPEKLKELELLIKDKTRALLDEHSNIRDRVLRDRLTVEIIQDVLYLGPLEDLLSNDDISEIMVNRWDKVYIEDKGKLVESEVKFLSEKQLQRIIERIVASIGRRVDMSSPMVDARLKDGSRVNAIIPPLAAYGSVLTIRKFSKEALTVAELIKFGTLNNQIAEFLNAAVVSRQNVIVSGGTGTGKTTLLNILSSSIPEDERIITIEDSCELQLRQPHVVTLEGRPPNIEDKGEVTIRDLVKNALRMRPDRIVVGECRSGEALDMLQAMNTGHDGSMTTIHANSSREMLTRLETLVMFAGFELPSRAIREQIVGAVDIVVQIERLKDGSRKLVQVTEILDMTDGVIRCEDVFQFKQTGTSAEGKISGDILSTGYVPKCLDRFEEFGLSIPKEMFWSA